MLSARFLEYYTENDAEENVFDYVQKINFLNPINRQNRLWRKKINYFSKIQRFLKKKKKNCITNRYCALLSSEKKE